MLRKSQGDSKPAALVPVYPLQTAHFEGGELGRLLSPLMQEAAAQTKMTMFVARENRVLIGRNFERWVMVKLAPGTYSFLQARLPATPGMPECDRRQDVFQRFHCVAVKRTTIELARDLLIFLH